MLDDKVQAGRERERWVDKIDFLISSLITAARSLALAAATILVLVLINAYGAVGDFLPLLSMLWPLYAWTIPQIKNSSKISVYVVLKLLENTALDAS